MSLALALAPAPAKRQRKTEAKFVYTIFAVHRNSKYDELTPLKKTFGFTKSNPSGAAGRGIRHGEYTLVGVMKMGTNTVRFYTGSTRYNSSTGRSHVTNLQFVGSRTYRRTPTRIDAKTFELLRDD